MIVSNIATRIDAALLGVCPIRGVSIGRLDEKDTWRIDFAPEASPEQQAAALVVLNGFDAQAPIRDDVNAERDRRLRRFTFEGREFDFCDGRGSDQNIAGAATLALAAVLTGVGWDENFTWISADNATVPMSAQTCLNFGKAAADWKARHIRAARALKDMSPIPADFADDSRW